MTSRTGPHRIAPGVHLLRAGRTAAAPQRLPARVGSEVGAGGRGLVRQRRDRHRGSRVVVRPGHETGGDRADPHPSGPLRGGRGAGPDLAGAGVRAPRRAADGGGPLPAGVHDAAGPVGGGPTDATAAPANSGTDRARRRHHRRRAPAGAGRRGAGAAGLAMGAHPRAHPWARGLPAAQRRRADHRGRHRDRGPELGHRGADGPAAAGRATPVHHLEPAGGSAVRRCPCGAAAADARPRARAAADDRDGRGAAPPGPATRPPPGPVGCAGSGAPWPRPVTAERAGIGPHRRCTRGCSGSATH